VIAAKLIALLDRVDTEQRRIWAARILIVSVVGWAVSHILLVATGRTSFFEHCLMAISWAAISVSAIDVVITSDVREQQDTTG
jgi:hypothetical protein